MNTDNLHLHLHLASLSGQPLLITGDALLSRVALGAEAVRRRHTQADTSLQSRDTGDNHPTPLGTPRTSHPLSRRRRRHPRPRRPRQRPRSRMRILRVGRIQTRRLHCRQVPADAFFDGNSLRRGRHSIYEGALSESRVKQWSRGQLGGAIRRGCLRVAHSTPPPSRDGGTCRLRAGHTRQSTKRGRVGQGACIRQSPPRASGAVGNGGGWHQGSAGSRRRWRSSHLPNRRRADV